jgi:hypothetical protein
VVTAVTAMPGFSSLAALRRFVAGAILLLLQTPDRFRFLCGRLCQAVIIGL